MAEANRMTSQERWKPGDSASQRWMITGAKTMADALGARNLPMAGATYSQDLRLVAQTPSIYPKGVLYYADIEYQPRPKTERRDLDEKAEELLNLEPEYQWGEEAVMEETDVDVEGNLIRNSAGVPFNPRPVRETTYDVLTVTRYVEIYDRSYIASVRNRVNGDTLKVPKSGRDIIKPRTCLFKGISCEAFRKDTPVFRITMRFLIDDGEDPWTYTYVDQGRSAFYKEDNGAVGLGELLDLKGKPFPDDVRLDGYGRPLNPSLVRITTAGKKPFSPFTNPTPGATRRERRAKDGDLDIGCVALVYQRYKATPFKGLGVFL